MAPGLTHRYGNMGCCMKTTVEIQDELLVEAKKHAAEHRTTIRALIESGLRHELGNGERSSKARLPVIHWVTVPGGLPKGMDVADRAKMIKRLMK
jgi:hypothetical protein